VYQDLLNGPLELGCVELALELAFNFDSESLLLEDLVEQRSVGVDAFVDSHPQAAQHDRDEAAGAGSADHVEVLAWPRRRVGVDGLHKLLEDHEQGQTAHAATVEGKEPDSVARHCGLYSQRS
jgi:hypothetical protein